jgi:hypothetical protein
MQRNPNMTGAARCAGAIFLVALTAAGCAPAREEAENHAILHCDDGRAVQVHFLGDRAVLETGGVSVAMTQRRAASGIWYAGGGQQLRGKGYDLTWTDAAGKAHACRDERADNR